MEDTTDVEVGDHDTSVFTIADSPPQFNLEKALHNIGGWTKWHGVTFSIVSIFSLMFAAAKIQVDVFLELEPAEIHCRLPPNISTNNSIPYMYEPITGKDTLSRCEVYENYDVITNTTIACPDGWLFSSEVHTVVSEFNLVCDRSHWLDLLHTVISLASPALAVILSALADSFGRRALLVFSIVMSVVCSVITYFSPDIVAYIVLRCLNHGFILTTMITAYVLMCEVFRTSIRPYAVVLTEIWWTVGQGLLLLTAYLVPHWGNILLITSCPFILVLLFYRFIPESPHWLTFKDKFLEVKTLLRNITHFNKRSIPQMLLYTEDEREKMIRDCKSNTKGCTKYFCFGRCSQGTYDVNKNLPKDAKRKKIFHTKYWKFVVYGVMLMSMFFVVNVMRGLVIKTSASRFSSVYLHFLFVLGSEAPSLILCLLLLRYFKRRFVICSLYLLCGVSLLTLLLVTYLANNTDAFVVGTELVLQIIALFICRATFITSILVCCEVFPTSARCLLLSLTFFGWKLGSLAIQHIIYLGEIFHWLPLVLIGVLSLILGALSWLLPETKLRPLQENFGETVLLKDKDQKSFRHLAKIGARNKKQQKKLPKGMKRFGGD